MNKVLVLAVHADDETLGCGGTLLKHKSCGDEIFWLIATSVSAGKYFTKKDVLRRKAEIKKTASMYGFEKVYQLGIPAMMADRVARKKMIDRISRIFNHVKPNIVYLPFRSDVHSDHRTVFEAAYSCTKAFRHPFIKAVIMMETVSETEFAPKIRDSIFMANRFVNITDFMEKKLAIFRIYKSENGKHPFPRSAENIRALATFRGTSAGCRYAEAFMVMKEIM